MTHFFIIIIIIVILLFSFNFTSVKFVVFNLNLCQLGAKVTFQILI